MTRHSFCSKIAAHASLKAVLVLTVLSGLAMAVLVAQAQIRGTVKEPLTLSPVSVDVDMYPNEERRLRFVVHNEGPADVRAKIAVTGAHPGIVVDYFDGEFSVSAGGDLHKYVTLRARNNAVPGPFTLLLSLERPE